MISLLSQTLPAIDFITGIFLSFLTLIFLIRLILTWYPKIDITKGLWIIVYIPSTPVLNFTKKIIPPIGGVDVTPVIWIGIISLLREILVGQQGLLKIIIQHQIN